MENQTLYVIRFLRQARIRLSLGVLVDVMLKALAAGFLVGAVINLIALFVPIYGAFAISWIVLLLVCIIGFFYGVLHFPGFKKTALEIDKKGLQERLTTFVEMEKMGLSPEWQKLQTEDTYKAVCDFNLKEKVKITINKKVLYALVGMIGLFTVAAVLPSPNKELAIILHEQKDAVQGEIEKVEEAKKQLEELKELNTLTEAELAEIEKMQNILEKAREELSEAQTKEEMEKALERLETKTLQQLSEVQHKSQSGQNKSSEIKKKLEEFLKKQENKSKEEFSAEELKDILEAEELENLRQEILEELEKAREELLSQLSEEELEELMKKLEELEEMLEELEGNLSEGSLSKEQLEALLEALQEASQNGSLSEAMSGQLAQIMDGTLGIMMPSGQLANGLSGLSGNNGNGNGTGNNPGNGAGTGNGSGQGQGNGNGSGIGGGKNYGSKNGIEKENNRADSNEQITIPGRNVGKDENLTGQSVEGESYQTIGGEGLTWAGEKVNYNEVAGEYTKEAYSRIENNEVPKGMEDVVKSYFEGINQ